MYRSTTLLACLTGVIVSAQRADEPRTLVAKKAETLIQEFAKGNYAALIDGTYPKALEEMGGRAKIIAAIEDEIGRMKNQGFSFISGTVETPDRIYHEGANTFVAIPTRYEMTAPGGRMIIKGYLLGISPDKGANWHFVDGAGLQDAVMRAKILPPMPSDLKLPAIPATEFIKGFDIPARS